MLGKTSFQILDQVCKEQLHDGLHSPLSMWDTVEKLVVKHWMIRLAGSYHFRMRKAILSIRSQPKSFFRSLKIWSIKVIPIILIEMCLQEELIISSTQMLRSASDLSRS